MGNATATASNAENVDTFVEVILGVPSVTNKDVARSASRTRSPSQFIFPARFQIKKAIVVVLYVDEYNCIWCGRAGTRILHNQAPALSSPFSQSSDTVNRQYPFFTQIKGWASTVIRNGESVEIDSIIEALEATPDKEEILVA